MCSNTNIFQDNWRLWRCPNIQPPLLQRRVFDGLKLLRWRSNTERVGYLSRFCIYSGQTVQRYGGCSNVYGNMHHEKILKLFDNSRVYLTLLLPSVAILSLWCRKRRKAIYTHRLYGWWQAVATRWWQAVATVWLKQKRNLKVSATYCVNSKTWDFPLCGHISHTWPRLTL